MATVPAVKHGEFVADGEIQQGYAALQKAL